eukprot:849184_1
MARTNLSSIVHHPFNILSHRPVYCNPDPYLYLSSIAMYTPRMMTQYIHTTNDDTTNDDTISSSYHANIAIDQIQSIKEMQLQYKPSRLKVIPTTTLKLEHRLRTNINVTTREIKQKAHTLKQQMSSEIGNDALLCEAMQKTRKDRQRTRHISYLQLQLQKTLNEVEELLAEIHKIVIEIEEYCTFQNKIEILEEGEYVAVMHHRKREIVDADVTNYFINNLNAFRTQDDKIAKLLIKFKLHIQSAKYASFIGTADEIEKGAKAKAITDAMRNKLYGVSKSIQAHFNQDNEFFKRAQKAARANELNVAKSLKTLLDQCHIDAYTEDDVLAIQSSIDAKENRKEEIKVKKQNKIKVKKRKLSTKKAEANQRTLLCFMKPKSGSGRKRKFHQLNMFDNCNNKLKKIKLT